MTLDAPEYIRQIDKSGMLDALDRFPEQIDEGLNIGNNITVSPHDIKKILIAGSGGSAFTGDVLQAYGKNNSVIPIVVNKDYALPRFTDAHTLVMVLSYSGNTEEALTAFTYALKNKSLIYAISSGGKLEKNSPKANWYIKIPGGFQPRAAVAYLLFPTLLFLKKCNLLTLENKEVTDMKHCVTSLHKNINKNIPAQRNMAKKIAQKLVGKIPKIYGHGISAPIARRWRTQFNENSKTFAFSDEVPECNHNEIESWKDANDFHYIFLRSKQEIPPIKARYDYMKEKVGDVTEVWAQGEGILAQMMYLMHMGDYISVYHAISQGIDPTPVHTIEAMKKKLQTLSSPV